MKADPMLDHLKRGGHVHFALSKESAVRCGDRRGKAASNYWPMVTCRKCQRLRTKVEGNVRESAE